MINVDSVSLVYGHGDNCHTVLQDISFTIKRQSSCAIIGPSGCGKTSLLFLLAGLRQPNAGTIEIFDNPRSGTILQNFGLFPWKTVKQNIGLGLFLKKRKKNTIAERTNQLLTEMDLTGFGDHYPNQLSGGMQQRVALARALAVDPEILFMDEPLSSLDALTRERLQNLILEVWQTKKITPVLVTHSIEEAVFLGQEIIILSKSPGKIVKIVSNPEAGDKKYREQRSFFRRCTELRNILKGEQDGE